jgi:hypothetical protein
MTLWASGSKNNQTSSVTTMTIRNTVCKENFCMTLIGNVALKLCTLNIYSKLETFESSFFFMKRADLFKLFWEIRESIYTLGVSFIGILGNRLDGCHGSTFTTTRWWDRKRTRRTEFFLQIADTRGGSSIVLSFMNIHLSFCKHCCFVKI